MAALFGNSSDGRNEPRSLVEFRAGKMKLTGSTVTADTRKGLVYMKQEDRLMHFYWKDRKSGEVVDVSVSQCQYGNSVSPPPVIRTSFSFLVKLNSSVFLNAPLVEFTC